jgi:ribose transport system substrate-binding protein
VTNVNERLAGGKVVAYVGTDDYQLALTTARYLINAMGKKGNVVILEGPDNLPTSIDRVRAYKDVLKEFPDVKLLASKSGNYARAPAADVMKSFLRLYPQIDGVLAANDPMAIGAVEFHGGCLPGPKRRLVAPGCRGRAMAVESLSVTVHAILPFPVHPLRPRTHAHCCGNSCQTLANLTAD